MDSFQDAATKRAASRQLRALSEHKVEQKEGPQHQQKLGEGADEHAEVLPQISHSSTLHPVEQTPALSKNIMQIPPCMVRSRPQLDELMRRTTTCPPSTPATLRELDLQSIQNNLNLRIDVCFDHDLFFQPVSGRKGDAKRVEAERYWLSLAEEFKIYQHYAVPGCLGCRDIRSTKDFSFERRLPILFANLKEIVEMLIPDSEHEEVANHLDVNLLMQQVEKGALDIVRLTEWLTNLLTSHCAPMRDCIAREDMTDVREGTAQSDMRLMVLRIEKLFGLLEAMKLDIANHQIRAFRYPLIEDAVSFQQDCFARAVEAGQMNIASSQGCYRRMRVKHGQDCTPTERQQCTIPAFGSFIHAMVRLCDPRVKKVPTTFRYDQQRFVRLQEDLQDLVQIDLCLVVYNSRVSEFMGESFDASRMHETLRSRIIYLTEDEDGNGGAISDHLDAIGMEITQAVFTLMEGSLHRTEAIADIEFARTTKLLHQVFEQETRSQDSTKRYLSLLEQRTMNYAQTFLTMSTLEVSSAQRQWAQTRSSTQSGKEPLLADWDDMARRLAHIGVLHWRVWADLCYLQDQRLDSAEPDSFVMPPTEPDFFTGTESPISTPMYNSATLNSPSNCQQPFSEPQQAGNTTSVVYNKQNRIDGGFADCIENSGGVKDQNMDTESGQGFDNDTGDGTSPTRDTFQADGKMTFMGSRR